MKFNEYQELAFRTANKSLDDKELLLNGVLGLCGEAGEVADVVKKYLFQGHELNGAKIMDELGDVIWYMPLICKSLGITMEDVAIHNIEKLKKRYPEGFSVDKSVNRHD